MGTAAGEQAAWAIIGNSIAKLLEPGEELKAFDELHDRKQLRFGGQFIWGWLLITPDGIELTKKVAIAVTERRLILFEAGGWAGEAKKPIYEVPLTEVSGVEKRGGINLTRIGWTAAGFQYEAASSPARAGGLRRALDPQQKG